MCLLTVAAAACGSSSSSTSTSSSSAAAAPSVPPGASASACERTPAEQSGTLNLNVDGHSRVVIVHVPPSYSGSTPLALVMNLHGSGSNAQQQELLTGMDTTADQDDFIVAYPQGFIKSGGGFDWNIPGVPLVGGSYPPARSADDVAFLTDLVPRLEGMYCIDPERVFATGISGGGRMSSQLGCDSSSTFAAVAPVAGLRYPSPCPASRSVPVVAFHGTADPVDPYGGNGEAYWTYSVPTAAQRWAVHDGCAKSPAVSSGSGYTLTQYESCTGGSSVELYSLIGEGHEWPGGPTLPKSLTRELGPQSQAVDANSVMWAFFQSHPMP